ncbi:TIGR03618 family F420-dependent PPOX class oxidoreductase [Streptomyces sp. SID8379]|uniref:TIGR03618 family F420-dependent PPOX class oxidoreductase n=1 Tax=unclassified Streptomyces TaxID=2593676 RepID=UPI00036561AA|nr:MULTISPECIES: TIGR03618 family F420-dependent PPOX class oxidoreductase [unclassified Streptomyces]MYW67864.1 TIGR03618 family F420-dependent PPOX class oxidoreductase [Streptomyces sp. SID8379]
MAGPEPRSLTEPELQQILEEGQFGTLASVRGSGHPHLSTVLYRWSPQERLLRISTTEGRLKPRQFRADPHAALHVRRDDFAFAVAEGEAEVSAPSAEPGDAVGRELLAMAREFVEDSGEEEFLAEQVAERRVVIRIKVTRLYGTALDVA